VARIGVKVVRVLILGYTHNGTTWVFGSGRKKAKKVV
jgi:hypothetical protein